MKAIALERYGPPEVLREMVLTVPDPGNDEVLVKVHATSVNPVDWKTREGHGLPAKTGFPRVLGYDVSGVVEKLGKDVKHLAVGDAVYGFLHPRYDGADAEYVRTRGGFLYPKPPSLTHAQAAAVPLAGLTALQALKLVARMKKGEHVLVIGAAGGVGHFAVQIAKAYGAEVTGVCSGASVDMVTKLGADRVIAYDREELPQDARYDIVFDAVKARGYADMKAHLTPAGRYVSTLPDIGGLIGATLGRLIGRPRRCRFVTVRPDPHGLRYLSELIESGRLRPVIAREYPLEALADAHRESAQEHVHGKLVIRVL